MVCLCGYKKFVVESDWILFQVVIPPHGRNHRNEAGSTHSSSMRHSEDKRPAKEVKRREDDRARTRERERDADTRLVTSRNGAWTLK